MKNKKWLLGAAVIALGFFASCKDEKKEHAQKTVDNYVVYVDSVEKVAVEDAQKNWAEIEAVYQVKMNEAEANAVALENDMKTQERITSSKSKYEAIRAKMMTESTASTSKQQLRDALFGEGKIGDDISFDWVNAANIHNVYQNFVHTAENNKDKYTREDWDEIKVMYEALDSRKNTVEKQGLSGEDNRKIAGLKVKFAPMLTVNRMGAKSEEMADAKE